MFDLLWVLNFIRAQCNFENKSAQIFNFRSRTADSNIILKIKELDLLWLPNLIALWIYFIFGTKFPWNGGIDTWFNIECVFLTIILIFLLGGYCLSLLISWWLLVVTAHYWWLLFVTVCYCSFPLLVWVNTLSLDGDISKVV